MRDIYIVGAKGIGQYGGYESFVQGLIDNSSDMSFHVACKANGDGSMKLDKLDGIYDVGENSFKYRGAECFLIDVPEIGPAQAIIYDLLALRKCIKEIKKNNIKESIVYVLACRIGPFFKYYVDQIHSLGGKVFINPDGHEWKRAKWSKPIRKYWKLSEKYMVRYADKIICDSTNIEAYIQSEYSQYKPNTVYISYGCDTKQSSLADDNDMFNEWLNKNNLKKNEYYLSVGRFVPENNFETMISEYMISNTDRDFAIITNVNDKFYNQLEEKLHFENDSRIKFVGTVYDRELLRKIRENAFAYIHGHEVGGTNPSLLEALGSTDLNLLYDVSFNREVAGESAFYWSKEKSNLSKLINKADRISNSIKLSLGKKARTIIESKYSWNTICKKYRKVWLNEK